MVVGEPKVPDAHHKFVDEFINLIVIAPCKTMLEPPTSKVPNPVVKFATEFPLVLLPPPAEAEYPEVVGLPEPICTIGIEELFTLVPLKQTVILLTQLGIPVKSIEVPDVLATAVPLVITLLAIVLITAEDIDGPTE